MTQPLFKPNWVQDTLRRYLGDQENKFKPYEPMQVETKPNPFDPSQYYGDFELLRNLNRRASDLMKVRVQNQQRIEEQKRQEEVLAAQRKAQEQLRAIDLSNVVPGFRGTSKKGSFGAPVAGRISSGYGNRPRPTAGATTFHQGIDFAAPMGTPIYATHSGYVTNAGWSNGYGYNASISNGGGVETFYGHQSKLAVKSGQFVQKGQVIGYVGSTGVSTGPHLHYGVKVNGNWVNPVGYF